MMDVLQSYNAQDDDSGAAPQLNKSKVGFMGFSAGAHLTGHLSVEWKTRSYERVDEADDLPCRRFPASRPWPT